MKTNKKTSRALEQKIEKLLDNENLPLREAAADSQSFRRKYRYAAREVKDQRSDTAYLRPFLCYWMNEKVIAKLTKNQNTSDADEPAKKLPRKKAVRPIHQKRSRTLSRID